MLFHQPQFITLSRQELYEKVWTTPTVTLAKSYGLSDVAVAKICKKHKIPKPSLGYWARLAVGKKVERKPLPTIAEPQLQQIRIRKRPEGAREEPLCTETKTAIAAEKVEANRLQVSPQLESPHSLIERTLKSLQTAAKNEFGLVRPKAKHCLDIAVSRDNIDRSVLIMDALVKALDERGYPVSVREDEGPRRTCVSVLDESIHIQLKEVLDKKERELTPAQRAEHLRWHSRLPLDYFPSGRLALCIVSGDIEGCRRLWADGATQRVEECLNSFICGLLTAAEAMKAARAERERWQREWAERERKRQEEEQRRREEEARIQDLVVKVTSWEKSQKIRHFLGAAEAAMTQKYGKIESNSQLSNWLAWAHRYADSLDPLAISVT